MSPRPQVSQIVQLGVAWGEEGLLGGHVAFEHAKCNSGMLCWAGQKQPVTRTGKTHFEFLIRK